ncbi:hypothetical protein MTP04_23330 [Lysinibacillus sp. PLM2]|nr:hypothetical protein MTP04_23330 [Lysinibacillus sp. PLM2]
MWNLTKEGKERFQICNLLPIHESDGDWESEFEYANEEGFDLKKRLAEDLEMVKEELLTVLPSRFIPFVEDGTLNQPTLPKNVREDYLKWMRESDKKFEEILAAAYENTKSAIPYLSENAQEVFKDSLHDSIIERIERENQNLHIFLNTEGGFTNKTIIHFTFKNVISEESDVPLQIGQWFIYNELKKTDTGFAFRVLLDCPDSEWTIEAQNIDASYYFRPVNYAKLRDERRIRDKRIEEYIQELNKDLQYFLITPDANITISSFKDSAPFMNLEVGEIQLKDEKLVLSVNQNSFEYDLKERCFIQFIYTNFYENPYAQFNIPVPIDELEQAAFSHDLDYQVRAWNTMYSNPEEAKDIVNRIFMKIDVTEENEMMLSIYLNHFNKHNILTEKVLSKFHTLIDE